MPDGHGLYELAVRGVKDTIYGYCTCQNWMLSVMFNPEAQFGDLKAIEVARNDLAKEHGVHTLDIRRA